VATPDRLLDLMKEKIRGSTTFTKACVKRIFSCKALSRNATNSRPRLHDAIQRLLRNVASSSGNDNDDDAATVYIEILDVDNDPQYSFLFKQQQEEQQQQRVQQSYIVLPNMKLYVSALLALGTPFIVFFPRRDSSLFCHTFPAAATRAS
jgi:hypothetical protein